MLTEIHGSDSIEIVNEIHEKTAQKTAVQF